MNATHYRITIGLLIIALLVAACGGNQAPTAIPTLTPAGSPTPIPPGVVGNPIRMFVISGQTPTDADMAQAAEAIAAGVQSRTDIAFAVEVVDSYAAALDALCASDRLQLSVAWLDGVGYTAARAMNCGVPTLQVMHEGDNPTGIAGQIIANRLLGTTDLNLIRNRTFCRLGYDDFYGWLLPLLVFKSADIDLLTAPDEVVEYPDVTALIQAVASGDCAAAGIVQGDLEQNADAIDAEVSGDVVVAMTTIPFPYPILVYPFEVDLGVRLAIDDALTELAAADDSAAMLHMLLGQDELVSVDQDNLDTLAGFMASTGYDFAQLGR